MSIVATIIATGSFVRAADVLDITPSGVSRAISRFEKHLGIRLFDRTTRSITLTDEGRRFYEQILPALDIIEEAANQAAGTTHIIRGRLRINSDPFFSRLILAPNLGLFLERYPALEVNIITRDQLGDLVAEGFDLAVRFGEPQASSLIGRKLLETRILTVASPSYIARHGKPLQPADLENGHHTCIHFRDPTTGRPFVWEFHKKRTRFLPKVTGQVTLNDVATMHGVCLAGYGIAQVMNLGVEELLANGSLVELFCDWNDEYFPLYAFYPSRNFLPAKVQVFLDFILSLTNNKK